MQETKWKLEEKQRNNDDQWHTGVQAVPASQYITEAVCGLVGSPFLNQDGTSTVTERGLCQL